MVSNECNRVDYYYNSKIVPVNSYSTTTLLETILSKIKNKVKQNFKSGNKASTKKETDQYFGSELLKPKYNTIGELFSDCEVLMHDFNNSLEHRFIF